MALLVLRVFQETNEAASSRALLARLSDLMRRLGFEVGSGVTRPYWKIPEYYELVLELTGPSAQFESALSSLGTNWTRPRPAEAVWDRPAEGRFLEDSVRWAHLEQVE
jgi:hypothetical protein